MKAALLVEYGRDLAIEEVAIDDPKAHEVMVRIRATGLCHSDFSAAEGKVGVPLMTVLGHEAAGIVEKVGPSVSKVRPGDRVILSWKPSCGRCFYCHDSHPTLCEGHQAANRDGTLWDGTYRLSARSQKVHHYACVSSFAEFAVVPEYGCMKIGDDIPFEVAALVGCAVTTGFGAAVNDARVRPGSTVAVIGVGGVGINAIQASALAGAERIIAVDINREKESVARAFGATHFVDSRDGDLVEAIRSLTKGRGVDSAIECTGRPAVIAAAYQAVRPAGRLAMVGLPHGDEQVSLPGYAMVSGQRSIVGSFYGGGVTERDFGLIFDLYRAGRFEIDRQIGARLPLARINEGFEMLRKGVLARSVVVFDA